MRGERPGKLDSCNVGKQGSSDYALSKHNCNATLYFLGIKTGEGNTEEYLVPCSALSKCLVNVGGRLRGF